MKNEVNTRPYLFKNDRAEFPHGYLEWKPEVDKPKCDLDHFKFMSEYQRAKDIYEADQQAIERSRVAVSEEFKTYFALPFSGYELNFYEGKDFTIRDGKAYPVEVNKEAQMRKELDKFIEDKLAAHAKQTLDLLLQLKEKDSELSRLRAENEGLKKQIEEKEKTLGDWQNGCAEKQQQILSLQTENKRLREALEPFDKLATECISNSNLRHDQDVYGYNKAVIKMTHLRAVKEALSTNT